MDLTGILAFASVVFGIGLYVCAPSIPVAIALPASFLVLHIGGGGGGNNFSICDAVLLIATLGALPLMHWRGAVNLRRWMVLVAIYQATTLLSVVNSPNRYDAVEWFHQIVMVAGAAIVGWVIIERDRVRIAIGYYLAIAAALSVWVIGLWFAHSFHPIAGLPDGLQKNSLGNLFVIAILSAYFVPSWTGFTERWVRISKYLCMAGVIATGSRQAMIGFVVAVFIVAIRDRQLFGQRSGSRRQIVILFILAAFAVVAYTSITKQIASHTPNSFTIRTSSYAQTLQIWHVSPLFGVGERYWYTGHFPGTYQPPNAEIGILATGGVVGLAGFLVLILGTLWMLWRLPPSAIGSFALAVMVAHVVEGQFDIFWVTGTGSAPWIILGMALAVSRRRVGEVMIHYPSISFNVHENR